MGKMFAGLKALENFQLSTTRFRIFIANERGAIAIEYALLAGLIAIACIVAFAAVGGALPNLFGASPGGIADKLKT